MDYVARPPLRYYIIILYAYENETTVMQCTKQMQKLICALRVYFVFTLHFTVCIINTGTGMQAICEHAAFS